MPRTAYRKTISINRLTTPIMPGCYCEDRNRCHIAVLSEVLAELGAEFRDGG
jgi:uncharacterized protein YeaO (DUF488 family)